MKNMRRRKNTKGAAFTISDNAELTMGDDSIIALFEQVVSVAQHSGLEPENISILDPIFGKLNEQLSISYIQAVVIAMLIDSNDSLALPQMAGYLGVSNISMMRHLDQINDLIKRRIIYKMTLFDQTVAYVISQEALDAFLCNQPYTPSPISDLTTKEFMAQIEHLFDLNERIDWEFDTLCKELHNLMNENNNLWICKLINNLEPAEQIAFLLFCTNYMHSGDNNMSASVFEPIVPPMHYTNIRSGLENGLSPLITTHLLEYVNSNGMADMSSFLIARNIRERLNHDLDLQWALDEEFSYPDLRNPEDIVSKTMFYNAPEQQALSQLEGLLQEERFQEVKAQLADNGLRQGFAILFYGSPGTGKTETVLQLAKATHRHVMKVDLASLRSKWVGQSEQNIHAIFKRYEAVCKAITPQPILFFNEADGIMSKRTTRIDHSTDKMENTLQNIILDEIEDFNGILIATTNLTSNMDTAFERRFLYKIEFEKPTAETRKKLWQSMLKKLNEETVETLAKKYDLTGGEIENIARLQIVNQIINQKDPDLADLEYFCKMGRIKIQNQLSKTPIGYRKNY